MSKLTLKASVAIFGTGYLGSLLAKSLAQQGHAVIATHTSTTKFQPQVSYQQLVVNLDIALDKVDWHTLASYSTWVILWPPNCSINYITAIKIILKYAELIGIQHIIYSSSTSVYGMQNGVLNELSELAPNSPSSKSIVAVEQAISISSIPQKDIIRLGGLYSFDRHPIYHLIKRDLNPNGDFPVNMVSKEQAVQALIDTINDDSVACYTMTTTRIRNLCQPYFITKKEFYLQQAKLLGIAPPKFTESNNITQYLVVDVELSPEISQTPCNKISTIEFRGKRIVSLYRDFDYLFEDNWKFTYSDA